MKKIRIIIGVSGLVICAVTVIFILVIWGGGVQPEAQAQIMRKGYKPLEGVPPPDILGRALLDEKEFTLSGKAWVGKTYIINNKEKLLLTNKSADSAHLKGMLSDLGVQSGLNVSAERKYVLKIYAEDVYYEILDKTELLSTFKGDSQVEKSPYISGIMKAKKLQVELVDDRGITASATLDVETFANLDAGLSSGKGVSAYRYAEDIIMGYKLQFPPKVITYCQPPDVVDKTDLLVGFRAWHTGMKKWVSLLEVKDRNRATGDPEALTELESGGMYKIRIKPVSGKYYVYIFNVDSKNIIYPIFPIYESGVTGVTENPLYQGSEVNLPNSKDEGYRLDNNTGTETFRVYFCRERNESMEKLVSFLSAKNNLGKYTDWKKACDDCKIEDSGKKFKSKGREPGIFTVNTGQGSDYPLILDDKSYFSFSFQHVAFRSN